MIWTKPLLHLLVDIEPWLNFIALMALLKAGLSRRFPAMRIYLALRCFTDVALFFILQENHFIAVSVRTQTLTYIYAYWSLYVLGAVAIFFALQEIFKAVMEPVPGLQRLGLIAFRWVSVASVVILLAMAVRPGQRQGTDLFLATISLQLMRCVSILEICLLAYLALSVHSLGRSFRGRLFGLGLGFGLEAAGELIFSLMSSKPGPLWSLANLFLMTAGTAAVMVWAVYLFLPEPAEERSAITLPVTSPLLRWNDIALALGQRPANVALGATSSAFFLQDVEQVVDKLLTKTQ
ncbi:MAG TPA: hypothetical protein VME86_16255 [Acidobacteriaceae bacterium]|jgi:hypothetical protein|nr:hypothetical protein [Acidobacteriaceae bacterium]